MSDLSVNLILAKALGLQPLEPLADAAAAYDAAMAADDAAGVNRQNTAADTGRQPAAAAAAKSGASHAALFARVLALSRTPGTGAALGCLAVLHGAIFAATRQFRPSNVKWLLTMRLPFFAPPSQICRVMGLVAGALSINVGHRILRADANACYDYYVRNGLRRRARCSGAAEIFCPIARLVACFSGKTCSAAAEPACPFSRATSPDGTCPVEGTPAGPAAPAGVGAQELNISTSSKGVETSHQTTALPTPRSASLRTPSFTLPDDVDAAIGVAAAHDSDEDTAWETEEVVEASPATGTARLVPGLHYHPHRRQLSLDSVSTNHQTLPQPACDNVAINTDVPVSRLPSVVPDCSASSVTSPSVVPAAASAPLLSRAAFIVRFEQHRRTAVRLYLGVHAVRCLASVVFLKEKVVLSCAAAIMHVGLLVRLRRELAYVDCSARASLGPLVAWSTYMLAVGSNMYLLNRS
jgi:hypothetical protein